MSYFINTVVAVLGSLILLCCSCNSGRQAHITLQVQFGEVILGLSNNPRDVLLSRALADADRGPSGSKFVERFATAYTAAGGDSLWRLFVKPATTAISYKSSDADVIAFLNRETAEAVRHNAFVLKQRLDTNGGGDRHWEMNETTGIITITITGNYSSDRLQSYLESRRGVINDPIAPTDRMTARVVLLGQSIDK